MQFNHVANRLDPRYFEVIGNCPGGAISHQLDRGLGA